MKKALLLFFFLFSLHALAIEFPKKPNPPKLVNDFTNTLTANDQRILEEKLVSFNDTTSIQIAVVILKTLDGYSIDHYGFELAEKWGIGQKKTSNGVLLLVSMEERKVAIAAGYGMEGIMPDALCRRIIENDIRPFFKQGQYYEGIDKGTSQMMALAKGEYKGTGKKKQHAPLAGIGTALFVLFLIFLFKIRSVRSYSSLNNIPFWTAWTLLNAASGGQRGRWTDFSSGRGGFGGFGGGGGGGGFGGFGGGSFGGGGASGSW